MDQRQEPARDPLTPVGVDIWIRNDVMPAPMGMKLPVRMTIIRLASGDLLLHSPTRYSTTLCEALQALGTIRYLLAPNIAHWTFIAEWQRFVPGALVLAAPGLAERRQVKNAGLRIDREVRDAPPQWNGEVDVVLVSALFFNEVALYHRLSRTLVLTDLVQNFKPDKLPAGLRPVARLLGITAPDGRAPVYLRLLVRCGGRAAAAAAARLVEFGPDRVIFAHGEWIGEAATPRLRRSLRWLTRAG